MPRTLQTQMEPTTPQQHLPTSIQQLHPTSTQPTMFIIIRLLQPIILTNQLIQVGFC